MSDILQEAETLIEKHTTSGYIHRDATLLLPGLVEEIKHLRVLECAAKANMTRRDEDIGDLMKELAKWQQIAIEERAKQMNGPCDFRTKYEWCDNKQASCDGFPHMWECCPNKDRWRAVAAKELDLQVDDTDEELTIAYMIGGKKADERLKVLQEYVRRLEKEFLDLKMNCCFVAHAGGISEEEIIEYKRKTAQAALEKIRRG